MSEAKILSFPQRRRRSVRSPSVEERQQGRFMIVRGADQLDFELEGLPDDVVAFAFRRMLREFRIGRSLDDGQAASTLRKHARAVDRMRREHGEFLDQMDDRSEHARDKYAAKRSAKSPQTVGKELAKSSNFSCPKPAETLESAPPDIDSESKVGLFPLQGNNNTTLGREAPFSADAKSAENSDRTEDQEEQPTPPPEPPPAEDETPNRPKFWETGYGVTDYRVELDEIARQQHEERLAEYRQQSEKWRAVHAQAADITSDLPKPDPRI